ncbi:uncharacterized protein LOC135467235 [Liolophura sinensis]|uniref:uncharacterized protein LOC135467235 n=1 Tax=Liolophura sinensis TaxID=3198878 RepID=UPI0031589F67
MPLTPHLISKWKAFFAFLDTDKDGTITFNDFDILARNFTQSSVALPENNAMRLHNLWLQWWWLMEKCLGENSLEITDSMYMSCMRLLQEGKYPALRAEFEGLWEAMFHIIDDDRDGNLTELELAVFYRWHGLDSEGFAHRVFVHLDLDTNGFISEEEFMDAMKEFWFGDDPNNDYSFMFSTTATPPPRRRKLRKSASTVPVEQIETWWCCVVL